MSSAVGFILLTHNKPHQIIRLVKTLNRQFDYPPIVCHHDLSKSYFPIEELHNNLLLVCPHIQTGWSKFSVVEAMLRALHMMYQTASPDWFILLSGADYPIKPAQQILHDLATSPYDVHMRYEPIQYNHYQNEWQELCYMRYCYVELRLPYINHKLQWTHRKIYLKHPLLTAPFLPFSRSLRCFAGEHWFCANRKAAEYLLEFYTTKPRLAAHYRKFDAYTTITPEESYYHTIFCNAPHLKVSQNHWRYLDWSTKGLHPKTLTLEDLPALLKSSAHFARKFDLDQDAKVLDELDRVIN